MLGKRFMSSLSKRLNAACEVIQADFLQKAWMPTWAYGSSPSRCKVWLSGNKSLIFSNLMRGAMRCRLAAIVRGRGGDGLALGVRVHKLLAELGVLSAGQPRQSF